MTWYLISFLSHLNTVVITFKEITSVASSPLNSGLGQNHIMHHVIVDVIPLYISPILSFFLS